MILELLNDEARAKALKIIAHADAHRQTHEDLQAFIDGKTKPVASDPALVLELSTEYRVVFSIEEQRAMGIWAKHISIMGYGEPVRPEVGMQIFNLFDFGKPIKIWHEPHIGGLAVHAVSFHEKLA